MKRAEHVEAVKDLLYELICSGGGDGDTLLEYANRIVNLTRTPKPVEYVGNYNDR